MVAGISIDDSGNQVVAGISIYDSGNEMVAGISIDDSGNAMVAGISIYDSGNEMVAGISMDDSRNEMEAGISIDASRKETMSRSIVAFACGASFRMGSIPFYEMPLSRIGFTVGCSPDGYQSPVIPSTSIPESTNCSQGRAPC